MNLFEIEELGINKFSLKIDWIVAVLLDFLLFSSDSLIFSIVDLTMSSMAISGDFDSANDKY